MHSTETELKSKCISNITVHINIYKRHVCLRKRLFSISPRPPPPDYSNPPDYCYIEPFPTPPPRLFSPPPFIRYSRVTRIGIVKCKIHCKYLYLNKKCRVNSHQVLMIYFMYILVYLCITLHLNCTTRNKKNILYFCIVAKSDDEVMSISIFL